MSKKRKEKANQSLENRAERKIVMEPVPKFEQPIEKPRAIGNDNMREALPEMTIPTAPNRIQSTTAAGPTKDVANHIQNVNLTSTPLTKGPEIKANAQVANPTTVAEAGKYTPEKKPLTFEEMLAEQRKKAVQEKTDALKMQKYYALNDVFNALGKMGGTAIGSAVGGGKVTDNATPVGEYQQSRNYINAFEKAKEANERLRKLDDTEFQLAYSKAQRDEERAYQAAEKKADRDYRQAEAELERQWQLKFYDYKTQIEQAIADKDWARSAQLKLDMNKAEQEYGLAIQRLRNQGALAEKQAGHDISKWQAETYNTTPIGFADGTSIAIPDNYYQGMVNYFMNADWDGRRVTKDNVTEYIKTHPAEAMEFLSRFGIGGQTVAAASKTTESPATASAPATNVQETNIGDDLLKYERKQ